MRPILLFVFLALPISSGCGQASKERAKIAMPIAGADRAKKSDEHFAQAPAGKEEQKEPAPPDQKKPKADQPRKIKYTADLRLIVEDFSTAEASLDAAIKDAKGMLKSSETTHTTGSIRTGTWRIRVPVENFTTFRAAVAKIGEVEKNTVDSEDITAQYYDLDAHIKNRIVERDAIRDLLKEVGKKDIKHFLEIKRELDTITDDINRKEGQLKLSANLTDLTTITVHLREKQPFIAEKKVEEKEIPTFGVRAGETWRESGEAFVDFLQALVIVAIAITPWLPIPLVLVLLLWIFVKVLIWLTRKPTVKAAPPDQKT